MELEENNQLPFLDLMFTKSQLYNKREHVQTHKKGLVLSNFHEGSRLLQYGT